MQYQYEADYDACSQAMNSKSTTTKTMTTAARLDCYWSFTESRHWVELDWNFMQLYTVGTLAF